MNKTWVKVLNALQTNKSINLKGLLAFDLKSVSITWTTTPGTPENLILKSQCGTFLVK